MAPAVGRAVGGHPPILGGFRGSETPLAQGHLLCQWPMCSEWSVWEDKGLAISSHPGSTQKAHPNSRAAHPLGRGWHWVCITAHLSLCPLLLPYPASQVLIPRVFPNQIHLCANLHLKICPLGPQPATECKRVCVWGGAGGAGEARRKDGRQNLVLSGSISQTQGLSRES